VYLIRKTDGFRIPYETVNAITLIALLRLNLLPEIKVRRRACLPDCRSVAHRSTAPIPATSSQPQEWFYDLTLKIGMAYPPSEF